MRWVDTAPIYCLVSFTVVVRSECTGYEHPFCSDAGSIPHSTLSHSGDSAIAYQVCGSSSGWMPVPRLFGPGYLPYSQRRTMVTPLRAVG